MVAMPTSWRFSWLRRFSSASSRATREVSIRWRLEMTSATLCADLERDLREELAVVQLGLVCARCGSACSRLRASAFESGTWTWTPKE